MRPMLSETADAKTFMGLTTLVGHLGGGNLGNLHAARMALADTPNEQNICLLIMTSRRQIEQIYIMLVGGICKRLSGSLQITPAPVANQRCQAHKRLGVRSLGQHWPLGRCVCNAG